MGMEVAMAKGATGTSMQGKIVHVQQVGKYVYCRNCKHRKKEKNRFSCTFATKQTKSSCPKFERIERVVYKTSKPKKIK
jgi:Zn finger protein HypA/HybF involved in hydrogenase expression